MKKIISKIKNHIFLTTVIFTLLFLLISFILYKNNILFRQWVYYLSGLLIYVGLILGITQLIRKIKNKIAKLISSVIFIICIILSILFLIISLITTVSIATLEYALSEELLLRIFSCLFYIPFYAVGLSNKIPNFSSQKNALGFKHQSKSCCRRMRIWLPAVFQ